MGTRGGRIYGKGTGLSCSKNAGVGVLLLAVSERA